MFEKCKKSGHDCKNEDVREILGALDPGGVLQRSRCKLRRRSYTSRGPNYLWHIDCYDKIKRFGLCINGCIDGYSRHVMWVNVYKNSNDPRVIGGYYMETVKSFSGCPRVVRTDLGTENTRVRDIQGFLRRNGDDGMAGDNAFTQGASTSNQRIEQWWGFLRRECAEYWIDLFNKMEIDGKFDGTYLDVNLIQFCFMHLVQVNSINISTLQFVHVNIMFERDLYHMMLLFSKHGKLLLLPLLLILLLLLLL